MPIQEIEEILKRYKEDEIKIEHLLSTKAGNTVPISEHKQPSANVSLEEVIARNKQLLKDLENAKANLRSKAIFSPSELQWEQIYHNYNKSASLIVTTYKCDMPVFV